MSWRPNATSVIDDIVTKCPHGQRNKNGCYLCGVNSLRQGQAPTTINPEPGIRLDRGPPSLLIDRRSRRAASNFEASSPTKGRLAENTQHTWTKDSQPQQGDLKELRRLREPVATATLEAVRQALNIQIWPASVKVEERMSKQVKGRARDGSARVSKTGTAKPVRRYVACV
ncbi:hypothetical protein LTR86_004622 [Recurvomyces mirabilis]|nr:hypothetical protein LTR86_004622 [Recurvomyces mirabilis]